MIIVIISLTFPNAKFKKSSNRHKMAKENHLQSGIAWAIPRLVEYWNEPLSPEGRRTWLGLFPHSSQQASDDLLSTAFDMIALIRDHPFFAFELKSTQHLKGKKNLIIDKTQLEALKAYRNRIPVYICCDSDEKMLVSEIEPNLASSIQFLTKTYALSPHFVEHVSSEDLCDLDASLVRDADHRTKTRDLTGNTTLYSILNDSHSGIRPDGWNWIEACNAILDHFLTNDKFPPNMFFIFIGENTIRCGRAETLRGLLNLPENIKENFVKFKKLKRAIHEAKQRGASEKELKDIIKITEIQTNIFKEITSKIFADDPIRNKIVNDNSITLDSVISRTNTIRAQLAHGPKVKKSVSGV
jgi:hypothetical protein